MTADECLTRLKTLHSEIHRFMDAFEPLLPQLRPADAEALRATMKALKEKLAREYKASRTWQAQAKMNRPEYVFYYPSIKQAYCHLSAPSDSIPDHLWLTALDNATDAIMFGIEGLNGKG